MTYRFIVSSAGIEKNLSRKSSKAQMAKANSFQRLHQITYVTVYFNNGYCSIN